MECRASSRCFMNAGRSQGRGSQISISLAPQTCWAPPLAHPSSPKVSWSSTSFPSPGFSFLSLCLCRPRSPGLCHGAPSLMSHSLHSRGARPPPNLRPSSPTAGPAPRGQTCSRPAMPHTEGSSLGRERSPSELYLLIWKVWCRVVLRADVSCTPRAFLASQGHCPSRKLPPEPVQCATNWPPHAKSRLLRLDLAPSDLGPCYNADSDLASWGGA